MSEGDSDSDLVFDPNALRKQARARKVRYLESHPDAPRRGRRGGGKGDLEGQRERRLDRQFEARIETRNAQALQPVGRTSRPILGLDGEARDDLYFFLASSDGQTVENAGGLSTLECLNFLADLPKEALKFGFSFTYDINMMLGDLSRADLVRLSASKVTTYRGWRIWHVPGKRFSIWHKPTGRGCVVWDVFPFVQCSFVRWLTDWKLADETTLETLAAMKDLRADFDTVSVDEIKRYCLQEVRYLQLGVETLLDLAAGSGIKLRSYYGAGSIAQALLAKHEVKRYLPLALPPEIFNKSEGGSEHGIAVEAYYGGRSEMSIIGRLNGPLHIYDINSAYPSAMPDLPCMVHGDWIRGGQWDAFSLVKVLWNVPKEGAWWGPFPMRPLRGSIRYPLDGSGWYFGVEVDAARGAFPGCIDVLDSWSWKPSCTHRPFAWVPYLYRERLALKSAGDRRHILLKLGLNSLYGKTAQSVGRGTYRCPLWAGAITASCRAQILRAVAQNPEAILSIATDGICSQSPLDLEVGDGLGQWDYRVVDWAFFAQCGVYFYGVDGGSEVRKSRGFLAKELDLPTIESELRTAGIFGKVHVKARRFVGYKTALNRSDWSLWRGWHELEKVMVLNPMPRRRLERPEKVDFMGDRLRGMLGMADMVPPPYYRTYPPLDSRPWSKDLTQEIYQWEWGKIDDEILDQPDLVDEWGW